jgi:hypothetical protein
MEEQPRGENAIFHAANTKTNKRHSRYIMYNALICKQTGRELHTGTLLKRKKIKLEMTMGSGERQGEHTQLLGSFTTEQQFSRNAIFPHLLLFTQFLPKFLIKFFVRKITTICKLPTFP